jgi:predicted ABC-type ATPase
MPEFLGIAGPNGARKSSFSKMLSKPNALIFDPDQEKLKIERNYPDISEDAVEAELTRVYRSFEIKAIGSQRDLTVETNLRNEYLAERTTFFKGQGYQTGLIFMMLPDLDDSMKRVTLRVKQKGHYVDPESITYNYRESVKNLYRVAPIFDRAMLIQSELERLSKPLVIAIFKDRQEIRRSTFIPDWVIRYLEELSKAFGVSPDLSEDFENRPKR